MDLPSTSSEEDDGIDANIGANETGLSGDDDDEDEDDGRPVCKYGSKCYRTNEDHLRQYRHPPSHRKQRDSGGHEEAEEKTAGHICGNAPLCESVDVLHWSLGYHPGQDPPASVPNKKTADVRDRVCKYWRGGFCRSLNCLSVKCTFLHPSFHGPTAHASYTLSQPPMAKVDEITREFLHCWTAAQKPKVIKVEQVENRVLEKLFSMKKDSFSDDEERSAPSLELWHGTHASALDKVLRHGFLPPADYEGVEACPATKKIGLAGKPSFCPVSCMLCTASPHKWNQCHMWGLGVYFAEHSHKSDGYVKGFGKSGRKMLRCEVLPGKTVEHKTLSSQTAMHDHVICPQGGDTIHVLASSAPQKGLEVQYPEYIVFHPFQVRPLYVVTYDYE